MNACGRPTKIRSNKRKRTFTPSTRAEIRHRPAGVSDPDPAWKPALGLRGAIDDSTISQIKELGGIAEIAISHPHYYTSMVEWSRAFGDAPIHIHEAQRPWVMPLTPAFATGKAKIKRCSAAFRWSAPADTSRATRSCSGPPLPAAAATYGRRPAPDLHGPKAGELHVELSQLYSAQLADHPARDAVSRIARIRPDLRRISSSAARGFPHAGQGSRAPFRRTLSEGDPRLRILGS